MKKSSLAVPKSKGLFYSQTFIDKTICQKITKSPYWTEELFGITMEVFVDRAIDLKYVAGCLSAYEQPSKFLCLLLKLIQIQPEEQIVFSLIQNKNYKYATALALMYYRLTAPAADVYQVLEPFYSDYRKLAFKTKYNQIETIYMDEYIDKILRDELVFDINMPRLIKRSELEEEGKIKKRKYSLLDNSGSDTELKIEPELKPRESKTETETPKQQTIKQKEPKSTFNLDKNSFQPTSKIPFDEDDELYWIELRKRAGV